jgi:hypothetical protein
VKVYAGTDPLTGREIRLRRTCKTERAVKIELGKLLAQAVADASPTRPVRADSRVGCIHPGEQPRVHPPDDQTRPRVHPGPQGPRALLDTLYVRLMRCGNLACTGKPFTEHRNIPDLRPDPADRRPEWEQVAEGAASVMQMWPRRVAATSPADIAGRAQACNSSTRSFPLPQWLPAGSCGPGR